MSHTELPKSHNEEEKLLQNLSGRSSFKSIPTEYKGSKVTIFTLSDVANPHHKVVVIPEGDNLEFLVNSHHQQVRVIVSGKDFSQLVNSLRDFESNGQD